MLVFAAFMESRAAEALVPYGADPGEESAHKSRPVDCDISKPPDAAILRYKCSGKIANTRETLHYNRPVSFTEGYFELKNQEPESQYVYQLGYNISSPDRVKVDNKRTPPDRFATDMPWGLTRFLFMIGALALFIFGMKTMSEGLQASAGLRLRNILSSMTRNRFAGVFSGFLLTGILQSSSATSVMTISFVNAGLITLAQSAGIIMGANIGTTVTGWIVSLLGFRFDITIYALALLAFASPLLLIRRMEWRSWGTALVGFSLLFLGLGFLKDTVPTFTEAPAMAQFFLSYSHSPVVGTLLFLVLGALIAIIVQSSSTAIMLTMALCASGIIPYEAAAAMVLGENIGTTLTAEIAAFVGNVHARRCARIHSLFNVIGAAWMVFLIPVLLPVIGRFLPANPFENSDAGHQAATIGLAAFHTVFNLLNLVLLIWFVPFMVKIASKTVRSHGDDENYRLEYIETPIQVSEIALVEAKQEIIKFADLTYRMSQQVRKLLTETDTDEQKRMHKRIMKYEKITDRMEVEIAQYCANISRTELSQTASERVRSILSISNDLERIGDVFYRMSRSIEKKSAAKIWFLPDQRIKLMEMFDVLNKAFAKMLLNLDRDESEQIDLEGALALELQLNEMNKRLKKEYISRIESGKYNLRGGAIFNDLFSSIEKAGDHIINVSEALVGEV